MEEYAELIHRMAEVYLTCVRDMRTQIAELTSENEHLRQELSEVRGRTDEWWEGGKKTC